MNLLAAKIYYDGSNWIAIPHTEALQAETATKEATKERESETI